MPLSTPTHLALLALCFAASTVAARRWFPAPASESCLAAGIFLALLVAAPVHALGWLGRLTPPVLAVTTVVAATALLGASVRWRARPVGGGVAGPAGWTRGLLGLLGECARARAPAFVGVAAIFPVLGWLLLAVHVLPSNGWDGMVYHEPMIGFALQHGDFREIQLADISGFMAQIDGFPRMIENISLWFVAFFGRRWIELPSVLFAPLLPVAFYACARERGAARSVAAGFAAALFWLPGVMLELRSTYIDGTSAGFCCAALHFALRRRWRLRDVLLGAAAAGLFAGSKVTGVLVVPILAGIALLRGAGMVRSWRSLARTGAAASLAAGVFVGLAAPTYVRNVTAHGNPLWPARIHVPLVGRSLPGVLDIQDQNGAILDDATRLLAAPNFALQFYDTRDNGYGKVLPLLAPPLLLVAWVALALRAVGRRHASADRRDAALTWLATALLVLTLVLSPARIWARLNLHAVIAVLLVLAWWLGRGRGTLVAHALVTAMLTWSALSLLWSDPGWGASWSRVKTFWDRTPLARAVATDGDYVMMPEATARARETELGAGDVVAFTTHPFPGVLWNESMTNMVLRVAPSRGAPPLAARLDALRAEWAVVASSSVEDRALAADPRWERVGAASQAREQTTAYRLRRPEPRPRDEGGR